MLRNLIPGSLLSGLLCVLCLAASAADPAATNSVDDGFQFAADDWPWWRGPMRNGTASPDQNPPIKFSDTDQVQWKTPIPGRGHGSTTVVGSRLFLATGDEDSGAQSILCLDRESGKLLWNRAVHSEGGMFRNKKASVGSSTPACDGERVYICFPNSGKLIATALSINGDVLWQREISNYVVHQGYGSSPALYQHLVIVTADNKGGGAIAALDRTTGEIAWRRERPEKPNYPSPILVRSNGRDQLVMVGCDMVISYDPLTGKTNWETEGATTECVTSTLTDGNLVFTSGGYPRDHMSAVRADGSGEVVWENKSRLYVPSLVLKDGFLFGVLDAGIATCWEAATGKEMWKKRLGGTFSSSPVLVGDRIYVCNEAGEYFVFEASSEQYQQLAKNRAGDEVFATPTIVGSQIFHRYAEYSSTGQRQEFLTCFGH